MMGKSIFEEIFARAPKRLRPILRGVYEAVYLSSNNSDWENIDIPDNLPQNLLSNAEILSNRSKLLDKLPKEGIVAELGVDEGDFSDQIVSITNPDKLYLVDVWASDRYNESKMQHVQQRFSDEINSGTVTIRRQPSEEALKSFDDDSIDWVYIDTTHSYNQTKLELEWGLKKVKESGFIAGHDYCVGNPGKRLSYGVIPAVHEFCINYDWELRYLTMELGGHWSFAIQPKI